MLINEAFDILLANSSSYLKENEESRERAKRTAGIPITAPSARLIQ
ncbi:MAG: hypothetical protein ACTS85_02545 [Arsenophonus sp. NC-PG7-MAG3]